MRALGAVLVLWGAAGLYFLRRREGLLPVQVGQAVLADLAALRCQICIFRRPLPEICTDILTEGLGGRYLWTPLGQYLLADEERTLPDCWRRAVTELPPPLGELLAPLGTLLPAGGDRLAAAIEETREELTRFLRAEARRQAEQRRVTAALCLCGASLLILVLI